jgi:hypothetical protein
MLRLWSALRCDECGFVVSSELAMVSTLGVLGLMSGLSQVAGGVNGELQDVAGAYTALDQSYHITMPGGQAVQYLDGDATR